MNNPNIHLISGANKKAYRKWQISEVRYDFEWDGYCSINISDKYPPFGTPFVAYGVAENELRYYKKQYPDCVIIIKEVMFKEDDNE